MSHSQGSSNSKASNVGSVSATGTAAIGSTGVTDSSKNSSSHASGGTVMPSGSAATSGSTSSNTASIGSGKSDSAANTASAGSRVSTNSGSKTNYHTQSASKSGYGYGSGSKTLICTKVSKTQGISNSTVGASAKTTFGGSNTTALGTKAKSATYGKTSGYKSKSASQTTSTASTGASASALSSSKQTTQSKRSRSNSKNVSSNFASTGIMFGSSCSTCIPELPSHQGEIRSISQMSGPKDVNKKDLELAGYQIGPLIVEDDYYHFFTATKDGQRVLLKQIMLDVLTPRYRTNMLRNSLKILQYVGGHGQSQPQCSSFIKVFDIFKMDHSICVFMEEAAGKSLFLRIFDNDPIPEDVARSWTIQLVDGVKKMHDIGVAHRFLKLQHILFDKSGQLKIVGWSKSVPFWQPDKHMALLQRKERRSRKNLHLPPECFRVTYDPSRVDMWSVGVIMVAMQTRRYPFNPKSESKFSAQWRYFVATHQMNKLIRNALNKTFFIDPTRRARAVDFLKLPYFLAPVEQITLKALKSTKDPKFNSQIGYDASLHVSRADQMVSSAGVSKSKSDNVSTTYVSGSKSVPPTKGTPVKWSSKSASNVSDQRATTYSVKVSSAKPSSSKVNISAAKSASQKQSSNSKPRSASTKSGKGTASAGSKTKSVGTKSASATSKSKSKSTSQKRSQSTNTQESKTRTQASTAQGSTTAQVTATQVLHGSQALGSQNPDTQAQVTQNQVVPSQGVQTQGIPTQGNQTEGIQSQGTHAQVAQTQGIQSQGIQNQAIQTQGIQSGAVQGMAEDPDPGVDQASGNEGGSVMQQLAPEEVQYESHAAEAAAPEEQAAQAEAVEVEVAVPQSQPQLQQPQPLPPPR